MRTSILRAAPLLVPLTFALFAACDGGAPGPGSAVCGDSALNGEEACDGKDLGGATCESLGFGPGELRCAANCGDFDRSQCGAPASCGDSKKDEVELCDGSDLAGKACTDLGYGEGTLACLPNCADFDVTACGAPKSCGDGEKNGIEACDGADLGGATCESIGKDGGTLACSADCLSFDTSACACVPQCGGLECGVDPKCGVPCGTCDGFSTCEAGACVKVCDLAPITANTMLDFDLKTVTLSGKVTLNGAALPNDQDLDGVSRGFLQLVDTVTGDSVYYDLGETGPGSYSFPVFAGTYDVYVESTSSDYQSVLPNELRTQIVKGLALTASMNKDIDLKTVTLSGKVTLNGAALPNDQDLDGVSRGFLQLVDTVTGDSVYYDLDETGPGNYSFPVFAGTYDVYAESTSKDYQSVLPNELRTQIVKGLALTASMNKDIDLKTVTLSGKVTLNGAALPNDQDLDGVSRGFLQLVDTVTGDSVYYDLGETGPGNYSFPVFAGTYDVYAESTSKDYQSVLPNELRTQIVKGLALTASMNKDIDLKTVTLSGKVTLNGAALPNDQDLDGVSRGFLQLVDTVTGDSVYYDLDETGPGSYSFPVFAGTYDVYAESTSKDYQSVLPNELRTQIVKGLALTASMNKDIDLKTVTLSGKVTLNGGELPNDQDLDGVSRGFLQVVDTTTGDSLYYDLGETGPGNYSFPVFAGTYDVYAESTSKDYQSVLPNELRTQIVKGLALSASMNKDIDLKTVTLSGKVTLNGGALPNDQDLDGVSRGFLQVVDTTTGDSLYYDLGETGPGNYSFPVFAGTYDVYAESTSKDYQSVLPNELRTRLQKGCTPD